MTVRPSSTPLASSAMELVSGRPNVELRRRSRRRAYRRAGVPLRPCAGRPGADDPPPALRLGHPRVVGAGRGLGGAEGRRGARALPRARASSAEVLAWLAGVKQRWIGHVSTTRHDGRGWWVLQHAGRARPRRAAATARSSTRRQAARAAHPGRGRRRCASSPRRACDMGAERCLQIVERGGDPPPARLAWFRGVDGEQLRLEVLWDPDVGAAFAAAARRRGHPRGAAGPVAGRAARRVHRPPRGGGRPAGPRRSSSELLAEHREAADAVRRSRATDGEPIAATAAVARRRAGAVPVGGRPLRARRPAHVPGRRAGAGQDGRGAGRARGRRRLPGDRRVPGVDEARLAARGGALAAAPLGGGRPAAAARSRRSGDITILNYEIVAAHREALGRRRPRALVVDESHYCKNPQAKRTQAVRRLAGAVVPDGLRLALTGTPVLNHADELIAQLRVIGRLEDFGSGARFSRQFRGRLSEERLHWHLRRRCFVRRLKSEVLPQLPAKRQVVVPVGADQRGRVPAGRARRDRLAALPAAGPVRAQRARSPPRCAPSAWPSWARCSGWPRAASSRPRWPGSRTSSPRASRWSCSPATSRSSERCWRAFPDALHLLGEDSLAAREAAIAAFQEPDGPPLIVCATRVAGAGDHADPRLQRRLPRARVDAGHARPGRGSLPPHRPARRRHRLVPARRRARSTRRWRG